MSTTRYTRIVLNERPVADITPTTFRIEHVALDLRPGRGEVLVQVNWLSLDPAMRSWLKDTRSYMVPVQIGEVMRAAGLATVVEAGEGCKLQPGDVVSCTPGKWPYVRCSWRTLYLWPGWTEYAVLKEDTARKVE
jgi:NADPH-dependent curcumin reductase CurA